MVLNFCLLDRELRVSELRLGDASESTCARFESNDQQSELPHFGVNGISDETWKANKEKTVLCHRFPDVGPGHDTFGKTAEGH